ncbi:DUF1592 domain-containing protein [Tundrisphaera lichenicola]|uniref:DUF1592 domain-containing protein n=1 Tax=Tundrisphaera lichenicola TaxID=2029860 RepID=UPI003EB6D824
MNCSPGRLPSSGRALTRIKLTRVWSSLVLIILSLALLGSAYPAEPSVGESFRESVEPILADHCYGCHGVGIKKGGVTLDEFETDESLLARPELWYDVLKNIRAGLMPPSDRPRPSAEALATLETWIKRKAFGLDPADPDPGRVTLRRLNRVEYRNTIRDLMGIDFRADEEFPADDTGYGFDTIADVLSISPLLLEKYMQAAESIVTSAVPTVGRIVQSRNIPGREFKPREGRGDGERLSLYEAKEVSSTFDSPKGGHHRIILDLGIRADFDFDPGRATVRFLFNGRELLREDVGWDSGKKFRYEFDETLVPGNNTLTFEVAPLVPVEKRENFVDLRINSVEVVGPTDPSEWARPPRYDLFFDGDAPEMAEGRREYARDSLRRFASRAFRRPVDERTLERLVAIAQEAYQLPGITTQQGISRAMVAILASPRFLFRFENSEAARTSHGFARIDELSLATRLSYFLWSSTPDDELLATAGQGQLRQNLDLQIKRMLADPKATALVRDFVGQWLQVRDFDHFPIQFRTVARREGLTYSKETERDFEITRRSMNEETEAYFAYVLKEDRPILELLDSDYTFVNESLAKHYEIPGVNGREIRKVNLPEGSPRGGLLTQAGVLMITSNPTRTSPVKRGQFILENILGTPTPPPPPDIPSLEDTIRGIEGRQPTMREVMEVHRADPLCASCHKRMDPLGLALENYNALGMYRTTERKQPIDASGRLVTGRTFQDARELKTILKTEHRLDFYRCLTEKLLTYALGRGIEYQDVESIDSIVEKIDREGGKFSSLLMGVIESAPFQMRREVSGSIAAKATGPELNPNPKESNP